MNNLIEFYKCHQDWINLIKDFVFFMGAFTLVKYLWNKRFNDQSALIEHALLKRERLEKELNEYVYEKHKNKVGIGIRFIFWKNYPDDLNDDAYAHEIFTYPREENVLPSGFINKTGVNFIEPLWRYSQSVYVNQSGIFFFDKKGKNIQVFKSFLIVFL